MQTQNQCLEKIHLCGSNPKEPFNCIAWGYSLFTHYSSRNKHDSNRDQDYMKKLSVDLREHATEIINCEKKEMLPLTDKEVDSCNNQKFCHIRKKKFSYIDDAHDDSNDDNYDNSINEKFDARKFHGNAARFDNVDNNHYHNDDHSNDKELNICKV